MASSVFLIRLTPVAAPRCAVVSASDLWDEGRSAVLYRGMDRAALDAAYNNGAAVADAPRFRADWASRSAALRERHAATLDIVYGAAPRAKLDLFLAEPPGRATLTFIHGGYWQTNRNENLPLL